MHISANVKPHTASLDKAVCEILFDLLSHAGVIEVFKGGKRFSYIPSATGCDIQKQGIIALFLYCGLGIKHFQTPLQRFKTFLW